MIVEDAVGKDAIRAVPVRIPASSARSPDAASRADEMATA
jgi:hypothetical protein